MIVSGSEQMGMPQKFDAGGGNPERPSENEGTDGVGSNDDRNESQKGIVDKGAGIDRELVEAKKKSHQSCEDGVKAEERREGDENSK